MAKSCSIALPKRAGETVTFTAHGEAFKVKKLRAGEYFLARDVASPPRSRFGNKKQICDDIAAVLENGALPQGRDSWH